MCASRTSYEVCVTEAGVCGWWCSDAHSPCLSGLVHLRAARCRFAGAWGRTAFQFPSGWPDLSLRLREFRYFGDACKAFILLVWKQLKLTRYVNWTREFWNTGSWEISWLSASKLPRPLGLYKLNLRLVLAVSCLLLCCCSVTQSCQTLCNSMGCSTPGFPVLHHLPEFAQTHTL